MVLTASLDRKVGSIPARRSTLVPEQIPALCQHPVQELGLPCPKSWYGNQKAVGGTWLAGVPSTQLRSIPQTAPARSSWDGKADERPGRLPRAVHHYVSCSSGRNGHGGDSLEAFVDGSFGRNGTRKGDKHPPYSSRMFPQKLGAL